MMLVILGLALIIGPQLSALLAINVFRSDALVWKFFLAIAAIGPFLIGGGVVCLIIALTQWFDHHKIVIQ